METFLSHTYTAYSKTCTSYTCRLPCDTQCSAIQHASCYKICRLKDHPKRKYTFSLYCYNKNSGEHATANNAVLLKQYTHTYMPILVFARAQCILTFGTLNTCRNHNTRTVVVYSLHFESCSRDISSLQNQTINKRE